MGVCMGVCVYVCVVCVSGCGVCVRCLAPQLILFGGVSGIPDLYQQVDVILGNQWTLAGTPDNRDPFCMNHGVTSTKSKTSKNIEALAF